MNLKHNIMASKAEQQKFQAQDDAYTMARYHEIMSDGARAKRAIKAAQQQAKSMEQQASSMRSAAKVKVGKTTHKKK